MIISKQSITGFWSFWQKSWHTACWANLNKDNLWHWWVLFNFFCWSCFFLSFFFFSVAGCFFNFLLGGCYSFMCAPWYACCSVSWLIVYCCAFFARWNGKRGGTCFTAAVMETFAKVCFAHCSTSRLALGSRGCSFGWLSPCPKYLWKPYTAIFLKRLRSQDIKTDIPNC